jgi:ferredoxin
MAMSQRLVVDFIKCDAHGICAELLPEWIRLDDWGYPVIDGREVPPALLAHARRAVVACPMLALRLKKD